MVNCGCRSVGECNHNDFVSTKALTALVDDFADEMKKKLIKKFMEGYHGWDDPNWSRKEIVDRLYKHIDKGDMVDVANFAMFAWNKE